MILFMDGTNDVGHLKIIDDDQLLVALDRLGVEFIARGSEKAADPNISPDKLIAGLANSDDARIRLALIPFFLLHPEFSSNVKKALSNVLQDKQHYLKCYYLAAYFLQIKYHSQLDTLFGKKSPLPALFQQTFHHINVKDADTSLHKLSKFQADLSNRPINWYGTYEHAYKRLVAHKAWKMRWQN